jgi:hypothetical protein
VFLDNFTPIVGPMTRIWDELKPDITPGIYTGWCFGTWILWLSIYWEFHHPNWRTPSFFRGVETTNQNIHIYICFPYHVPFNSLDILDIFILYFALVSWGSWRIFQLASCKRWQFANWKNIPCLRTVSQLYIDMNRPFSSSQTVTNYQTVYQNYTVLAAAI